MSNEQVDDSTHPVTPANITFPTGGPFFESQTIRSYWVTSRRLRNLGLLPDECTVEEDVKHVITVVKMGPHKQDIEEGEQFMKRVEEALVLSGRGGPSSAG